ncbi:c6 zinc finger protein [Fusarium austroafricanum]|uniref:C6 zinc finger protein n=1 Tax=Fusarium austroafricanum TaxID=2364996 RepID=A0A8H4NT02_9HYPO|nr:c6 zinc finger protein [Fusarium austroafricanum]
MDSFKSLAARKMDRSAASRQKSCNACVRGKRKCDKKTPRCTRCAAKGLDCVYQRLPPGANFHDDDIDVCTGLGATDTLNEVPDFDMGFDINNLGGDSSACASASASNTTPESLDRVTTTSIELDSPLDFSIIDHLMANDTSVGSELWNMGDYGNNKLGIPHVPSMSAGPVVIRDMARLDMADPCMADLNPLDVYDPRTRVGYTVDVLTNLYRDFARTRRLPFIHPRLYGSNLPKTMLAAFSAASAYSARTPENKGWVYKLITDMAKEIHREGERASTPAEKLARVQALVVLDSMRMFDGDVTLRATSERELPQFMAWMRALKEVEEELPVGDEPFATRMKGPPPPTWESWLLAESVRRTVIMAFAFVCMTNILKSLEPPCEIMDAPDFQFTASRYLWEADSSVAFYRAWQTKPQYPVRNLDFKGVWLHAQPEDVDEFTKLMLIAQMGPEAIDQFMMGSVC